MRRPPVCPARAITSRPSARGAARPGLLAVSLASAGLMVTGCAGSEGDGGGPGGGTGQERTTVVTSTTVYADVAEQIGGEGVEVVPIIDSPAQDPHSYEATPQDRLTIQDADLVILNGGGYDTFMEDLIGDSDVPVIDAVELSGLEDAEGDADHADQGRGDGPDHGDGHGHEGHDHGVFNEHVWYDLPTMQRVSEAVGRELGALDQDSADDLEARAEAYAQRVSSLHDRVEGLGLDGRYLATEPVADHLLEDAGLEDATPEAFTAAVENGTDIPAQTYAQAARALEQDDVQLLVVNEHTASGQTDGLRDQALEDGVPVLPVTETMPEGQTYLDWMTSTVDDLASAR